MRRWRPLPRPPTARTPPHAGLPEPWELLVRPAGSEEAKDSSFCLEDEALQDQVEQATKVRG